VSTDLGEPLRIRLDEPYRTACRHPTWARENGGESNQRLEFLGDAVLQLCVSELLFDRLDEAQEGRLTQLRSTVVQNHTLATKARQLGLGPALQVGRGARMEGVQGGDRALADLFEALLGAVYLDQGFPTCRMLVAQIFAPELADMERLARVPRNPTSHLQEWTQAHHGGSVPSYELLGREGDDHALTWHYRVLVAGKVRGEGSGSNKKVAKASAALDALHQLGLL